MLPQDQRAIGGFVAAGGDRATPMAVFGVKKDYIEASFDKMRKRYKTIEKDFEDGLGIDAAGQKRRKDIFLRGEKRSGQPGGRDHSPESGRSTPGRFTNDR